MAAAPLFESPSSWGPQPSPTQWVGWGEEEQGSGGRDAQARASRRERTLRRRGRRGAVSGYGRFLQPQINEGTARGRCDMYPLFESPSSWGPQPSPTQWVGWGEEEQGSGGRDAQARASRRERTLRRRGRRGAVSGYGRFLQPQVRRSAERPGAGAQRAAQTKKQLRRSVRIYREVKDKAGRNGLPCPFYTV